MSWSQLMTTTTARPMKAGCGDPWLGYRAARKSSLDLRIAKESAKLGYALGTAGDVNGDGFSDIIIGAPSYTIHQSDEGKAYVFQGNPTGYPSFPPGPAGPTRLGAAFGWTVGTAGDVNGDGYSEIIVAALGMTTIRSMKEGSGYVMAHQPVPSKLTRCLSIAIRTAPSSARWRRREREWRWVLGRHYRRQ